MSVKAIPWPAEVSCWEGLCCSPSHQAGVVGTEPGLLASPGNALLPWRKPVSFAYKTLCSSQGEPRTSRSPASNLVSQADAERRAQVCGRQLGALPERRALRSGPRDKVRAGYFAAACDRTCAWSLFFSRGRNRSPSHGAVFMPFWWGLYQSPKHG